MEPESLEIFDFDWTLFRSPHPPPHVSAIKTFIHSPESLGPPYVPHRPGTEFWVEYVVDELRAAQRRIKSITALITARRSKTEDRIMELMGQRGLDPDFANFRARSFQKDKDQFYFKRRRVIDILDLYPTISNIVIWEDSPEQIDSIMDLAKRRSKKITTHLIREPGGVH